MSQAFEQLLQQLPEFVPPQADLADQVAQRTVEALEQLLDERVRDFQLKTAKVASDTGVAFCHLLALVAVFCAVFFVVQWCRPSRPSRPRPEKEIEL
jgi:hypothetical protein